MNTFVSFPVDDVGALKVVGPRWTLRIVDALLVAGVIARIRLFHNSRA